MGRIVMVICIVICVGVLLVACSSIKSFEIPSAAKVELRSGNTGNIVEIIDADSIEQITNNINSLWYEKGNSSNDYTGWSHSIKWYNMDGSLIEEIVILGNQAIDYEEKFYSVSDGIIDIELLDGFLNENTN